MAKHGVNTKPDIQIEVSDYSTGITADLNDHWSFFVDTFRLMHLAGRTNLIAVVDYAAPEGNVSDFPGYPRRAASHTKIFRIPNEFKQWMERALRHGVILLNMSVQPDVAPKRASMAE